MSFSVDCDICGLNMAGGDAACTCRDIEPSITPDEDDARDEVRALRERVRELEQMVADGPALAAMMRELPGALRLYSAQVDDAITERDNARCNARVLAHAYTTDNRPLQRAVDESLAYPAIPERLR